MADTTDPLTRLWTARPDWFAEAACRGMGPDLWFPTQGGPTRDAIEVCNTCPVRAQCADAGRDERFGLWGGDTGFARRRARPRMSTTAIRHATNGGYTAHVRRGEEPCDECKRAMRRHYDAKKSGSDTSDPHASPRSIVA